MSRKANALRLFKERFNCSQAVFCAYRQEHELDEPTALKLATAFGAGVAGTGRSLCGAVTGGLMAISMKHGREDLASVDAKVKTYQLGAQFMAEFEAKHGSCKCEDILGLNIGTPEGHAQANQQKLFETKCLEVVESAADILEELL